MLQAALEAKRAEQQRAAQDAAQAQQEKDAAGIVLSLSLSLLTRILAVAQAQKMAAQQQAAAAAAAAAASVASSQAQVQVDAISQYFIGHNWIHDLNSFDITSVVNSWSTSSWSSLRSSSWNATPSWFSRFTPGIYNLHNLLNQVPVESKTCFLFGRLCISIPLCVYYRCQWLVLVVSLVSFNRIVSIIK